MTRRSPRRRYLHPADLSQSRVIQRGERADKTGALDPSAFQDQISFVLDSHRSPPPRQPPRVLTSKASAWPGLSGRLELMLNHVTVRAANAAVK